MKSSKVVLLCVLVALFSLSLVIFKNIDHKKRISTLESKFYTDSIYANDKVNFYKGLVKTSIHDASREIRIPSDITFLTDSGQKIAPFKKFSNSSHLLLYIYSLDNCEQCISAEIANLSRLRSVNVDIPIILVLLSDDPRTLTIQKQSYNTQISIMGMNKSALELGILKEQEKPYYLLVSSSFKVSNLFTPSKEDISLTDAYFEEIKAKFRK